MEARFPFRPAEDSRHVGINSDATSMISMITHLVTTSYKPSTTTQLAKGLRLLHEAGRHPLLQHTSDCATRSGDLCNRHPSLQAHKSHTEALNTKRRCLGVGTD